MSHRDRSPILSEEKDSVYTLDDNIPQLKLEKLLDQLQQQRFEFSRHKSSSTHVLVQVGLLDEISRLRALINKGRADPYMPQFYGHDDDSRSTHVRRREVAHMFVSGRLMSGSQVYLFEEDHGKKPQATEIRRWTMCTTTLERVVTATVAVAASLCKKDGTSTPAPAPCHARNAGVNVIHCMSSVPTCSRNSKESYDVR